MGESVEAPWAALVQSDCLDTLSHVEGALRFTVILVFEHVEFWDNHAANLIHFEH
jgi:hypothetical protein